MLHAGSMPSVVTSRCTRGIRVRTPAVEDSSRRANRRRTESFLRRTRRGPTATCRGTRDDRARAPAPRVRVSSREDVQERRFSCAVPAAQERAARGGIATSRRATRGPGSSRSRSPARAPRGRGREGSGHRDRFTTRATSARRPTAHVSCRRGRAGRTSDRAHEIGESSVVVIDYTVRDEPASSSTERGGRPPRVPARAPPIVPGLEAALEGHSAGDTVKVVVFPKDGYARSRRQPATCSARGPPPAFLRAGGRDAAARPGPRGEELTVWIVGIEGSDVLMSPEHPLAGSTLHFEVQVRDVRCDPAGADSRARALARRRARSPTRPVVPRAFRLNPAAGSPGPPSASGARSRSPARRPGRAPARRRRWSHWCTSRGSERRASNARTAASAGSDFRGRQRAELQALGVGQRPRPGAGR